MKFPLERFNDFSRHLVIDTKEEGQKPLRLLGTQRFVRDEIIKGWEDGIHNFTILKGRQLGISTFMLAVDMFWLFNYPGLNGLMITDTDSNRDFFRSVLTDYYKGLPLAYRVPVRSHNRNLLALRNRSKLNYLTAGTKKSNTGKLGRGKGANFLHGTECAFWGDEAGFDSLRTTLAEKNPYRLYVFESTANGFNIFYDAWQDAKNAITQRAIFVGWWLNEMYRAPKGSKIYNVYWDGQLTGEEREWTGQVKFLYDYAVTPEQIAWYRWQAAEEFKSPMMLMQEFPPTEEHAFVATGFNFFPTDILTEYTKAAKARKEPTYWKYQIGDTFDKTCLVPANAETAHLKIWEEPHPHGIYVIGADPAYGSSENKDRFAIQVLRCYANGVDQVAEYCTTEGYMYSFAWIIAHLAGAYRNSTVLIELNGPGRAVFQEFRHLTERAAWIKPELAGGIQNVLGNIAHYLYRRVDSLQGAPALQWVSTPALKERMMNTLRDTFARRAMKIHSLDLLDEMRYIVNDEGSIQASGTAKDDMTIAMGLAVNCWAEQVLPDLLARGLTREAAVLLDQQPQHGDVQHNLVADYLQRVGLRQT